MSGRTFTLAGPFDKSDPNLPVRGDLAHISLAGRIFVPHYAVPLPHRAGSAGAVVRKAARPDSEIVREIVPGTRFEVLDMTGEWVWGLVGTDGPVGYVLASSLERNGE